MSSSVIGGLLGAGVDIEAEDSLKGQCGGSLLLLYYYYGLLDPSCKRCRSRAFETQG